ncbi:ankyrin repeat domain-containing protein [Candidatus Babeliales bacterium]|nr:ankyrin repeat domain-containing protein [Candidatus Babeliales bacterium]
MIRKAIVAVCAIFLFGRLLSAGHELADDPAWESPVEFTGWQLPNARQLKALRVMRFQRTIAVFDVMQGGFFDAEERAKKFVRQGVVVNAIDAAGETLLHIAVRNASLEVVELLVERGARVDCKNLSGQTPFDLAQHLSWAGPAVREGIEFALVRGAEVQMLVSDDVEEVEEEWEEVDQ